MATEDYRWGEPTHVVNLRFGGYESRAAGAGLGFGRGSGASILCSRGAQAGMGGRRLPLCVGDWEGMVEAVGQSWSEVLGSKRQLDQVRAEMIPEHIFETLEPHIERQRQKIGCTAQQSGATNKGRTP